MNNGLELLRDEMSEGADSASMDLLEFSSGETLNRLLFFRLAFGAAGGLGVKTPVSEARSAAEKFFEGRRVGLNWLGDAPADLPQPVLKLLLNLIMLVAESLPRGGELTIEIAPEALKVTGTGAGALFAPERREALAGTIAEDRVDARVIQAVYAGELARGAGISVDVQGDGGAGVISLGARSNSK